MPITPVYDQKDFQNQRGIINLADATQLTDPVTLQQLNAAIEGIKPEVARLAATGNVNISSPGTTFDGETATNGDILLLPSQSDPTENGRYIFTDGVTPLSRALGSDTPEELVNEVVTITSGATLAGRQYRQTSVSITLGTTDIVYIASSTTVPNATETTPGLVELATQAEVDGGTDTQRAITPAGLANSSFVSKKFSTTFGDGSATSFNLTHNHGTKDISAIFRETAGQERAVSIAWRIVDDNTVTVETNGVVPANNALTAVILA